MSIYSIFYEKLPYRMEILLPQKKGKLITFLNPFYIEKQKNNWIYIANLIISVLMGCYRLH